MPAKYTPRLSVEVSPETYTRLTNRIPWGLKGKIMVILLEDLLDLIEEHGDIILAGLINRSLSAQHIVKGLDKMIKEKEKSDGS